ncbi:MAG: phosphohistidine phosphatase SixA [Thermodesulfobacteriota bacterium]
MNERRVYIVRHAIAEEQSGSGRDEDRSLTAEGRKKMRRAARGLVTLGVLPERIVTSPLVRARQTAEILGEAYPGVGIELTDALAPGVDERTLTRLLNNRYAGESVALVGHEPDLSELLSYWLTGSRHAFETRFKKGAVACLATDELPPTGKALLEWLLTAGQLGAIAG